MRKQGNWWVRQGVGVGVWVGMVAGMMAVHVRAQQAPVTLNTQNMEQYVLDVCNRVGGNNGGGQSSSAPPVDTPVGVRTRATPAAASPENQADLGVRCSAVVNAEGNGAQIADQMGGSDFNAIKYDAVLFATEQNDEIDDRVRALRANRKNTSTADLRINGLPALAQYSALQGGGASADLANEAPWGFWARINHASGDKDQSVLTGPFDVKHTSYTAGLDYRYADAFIGASLSYRGSDVDFGANGERGGFDSKTTFVSLYATSYFLGNFYADAILNVGKASYDSQRHIAYDEFGTPIDRMAVGSPDGRTLSVSGSVGYDHAVGGFTLTPSLAYQYVSTKVDGFAETGADGLDLEFAEQRYRSSSLRVQLNASWAINTSSAVLLPYLRGAAVKEFKDDTDVFGVRFVNDPDPTATVPVTIDALDNQYYRLAAGLSAQWRNQLSAYVDYQMVSGFQNVSFRSASIGVRKQF